MVVGWGVCVRHSCLLNLASIVQKEVRALQLRFIMSLCVVTSLYECAFISKKAPLASEKSLVQLSDAAWGGQDATLSLDQNRFMCRLL